MVQDLVDFVLLAALQIYDCILSFLREGLRVVLCCLNELSFSQWVDHDKRMQDVELGKIEVVTVIVKQVHGLFLKHVAASQKDAAVVALDWCLPHHEFTKLQIVVQFLLLIPLPSFIANKF